MKEVKIGGERHVEKRREGGDERRGEERREAEMRENKKEVGIWEWRRLKGGDTWREPRGGGGGG